jgi:hypothetical protein
LLTLSPETDTDSLKHSRESHPAQQPQAADPFPGLRMYQSCSANFMSRAVLYTLEIATPICVMASPCNVLRP